LAKLRKFYDLDNAAKIFPVVANEDRSYMFRLSIVLKEEIVPEDLQKALNRITKRFKHLNVRIRKGLFWFFFEENLNNPILREENGLINEYLDPRENNGFLFRTFYYKNRLSVEFFHALTDGKGALEFINSLAYEYLTLRGAKIDPEGIIITADVAGNFQEVQDAFQQLYNKQKIYKVKEPKAYHLKGTFYANHYNALMHAYISVEQIRGVAKNLNVSVTELIVGMIILAAKRSGGIGKHYNRLLEYLFQLIYVSSFQPFRFVTLSVMSELTMI